MLSGAELIYVGMPVATYAFSKEINTREINSTFNACNRKAFSDV
jgi:hypothetical protein